MCTCEKKVVVLGLDGATWKVLNPLIGKGALPVFRKLVSNGASGTLVSTIPPITSPAWPSMATGLNPGKLGVYSTFRRVKSNEFSLKPVTSSVYRGKAVWDFLSDEKLSVALFKIPFLYPVYKIGGCMVSGFGSTSKIAAYPTCLNEQLVEGPSSFLESKLFKSLYTLDLNNTEACVRYIEDLRMLVQKESELIRKLIRTLSWHFLFYVVSPTDWLQHAFMDRITRLATNNNLTISQELRTTDKTLIDFYKSLDVLVGQFLSLVEQQADEFMFLIVSDHGFTIRPHTLNLAKWLIENRYMKLRTLLARRSRFGTVSTLVRKATGLYQKVIPEKITEQILKNSPSNTLEILKRIYSGLKFKPGISQYIDFDSSKVFCLEDRGIYVGQQIKNLQKTLDEFILSFDEYLSQFPHLTLKTFKRSEIYWGNKVQLAPDLIVKIFQDDKIWEISTDPTKPQIFKPRLPGIHDNYGIFVAYGSEIKQNTALGKIPIWNICPTILHYFGLQIPSNIDGKVLKQIFSRQIPKQYTAQRMIEKERIRKKVQKLKERRLV